jgi:hypothetical protein
MNKIATCFRILEGTGMRTKLLLAAMIFSLTVVHGNAAQEAQELSCTGKVINRPPALSGTDSTLKLTLGPAKQVALDLGNGHIKASRVSDNAIQLKFRTKDFEGEYFHYTGDLFLIYKSGKLARMTCQK